MMCGDSECYIRGKTCSQVYDFMGDDMEWNVEVTFTLVDSNNTQFDVQVPMRHLFIEGEELLQRYKGDCYLGIFANKDTSHQTSIYLGNLFMQEHYVVYDATPVDDYGWDFLQIGIGFQNAEPPIRQYEPDVFLKHDGNGYRYYNWTRIEEDGEEEVLETDDVVQVDDVPDGTFPGPHRINQKEESDSTAAVVVIIIAVIVIAGIGFYCYRRRKAKSSHTFHSEAHAPMN